MEVPKFFFQKSLQGKSVAFVVAFSMLYMAIYQPFSATAWFGFKTEVQMMSTISFYVIAVFILLICKYFLYKYQFKHKLTIAKYGIGVSCEFVAISILYLLFTHSYGFNNGEITLHIVIRTTLCVALILAIPYTIVTLYSLYKAKTEEYNMLLLQWKSIHSKEGDGLLHLCDYTDTIKLSISSDAVIYVESQDNYVQIHYLLDDKLQSYLLRVSTQKLEEQFSGTSLMRCHRSFIINTSKIKLFREELGKSFLVLEGDDSKRIPISKNYLKAISERVSPTDT